MVEVDGHEWHERTRDQAACDRRRDRDMLREGLRVVRFTGSEVWRDAAACAQEIEALLGRIDERTGQITGA